VIAEAKKPSAKKSSLVPKEFFGPPDALFNPTVNLMIAATLFVITSTIGYFYLAWPHWICFMMNVLALHMAGTVIHDASHNVAHKHPIANAVLGHSSALMLGFAFPVFTRVHLQHHGNVNDPENDPDHFVSTGGPLWMIAARFFYHEIFFFKRKLWRKGELLEWFLSRLFLISVVVISIHFGCFAYVLNYWFSAALVVGIALGLFFDYLPHRPFTERNRWKNARVYPSRILNIAILGQNYHLIHHLWPSIPWYSYESAYHASKELLDEKGCEQQLDLFSGPKSFASFVYDIFLGIRFHSHQAKKETK
jgi:beta-carotene hydroxylase